ncbi:hypothetical protein [Streptomyces sp. NPDC059639]|uniref:hypothetical protein n=1 Tax=Streptomyces sp. NPDC059639 TaxID=3346891 RepID=UPI0036A249A3
MTRRTGIGAARGSAGAVANRPSDGTIAQGRNYDRVRIEDLPEPEDVGDKEGDLDDDESRLMKLCSQAVDEWEESTYVAAKALANIRERRLYRAEFPNFEEYCRARFSRGRLWGHREIERYQVTRVLFPAGNNTLLPGSQSREIAPTLREDGPEAAQKQYQRTKATGKVTGERLRQTREKMTAERLPKQATPEAEIVEAEIVDEQLAEAKLMLADLNAAWKRWGKAMAELEAAETAGDPMREEIARAIRRLATASKYDNAVTATDDSPAPVA